MAPSGAAVVNWLWLASTPRRERALAISLEDDTWADHLRRHFAQVEERSPEILTAPLDFEDQAFDCVAIPGVIGLWTRMAPQTPARVTRASILGECRRVLRRGGVLLLSGRNPQWLGEHSVADLALGRAISKAGFLSVREYFADPSASTPHAIIPACRSAALAYERQERALRGRSTRLLAAVGLHAVVYPGRLVMAFA